MRVRELFVLQEAIETLACSTRERLSRKNTQFLTFLCCCCCYCHTASHLIVVVATVLCPRRSDSCHSHDEINDFCDLRCCRWWMLMKYQPWDVMLVTRVRPSNVVLLRGDAMDVGWWTINWDCFSATMNVRHVCLYVNDGNRWRSIKRSQNLLINLTNKSLFIGWPDKNEPCPTPFVKLLLNCDEYVVDVIARLDDDFWTVFAWMTWRAPPFDVIVCVMFICLCCEWIPSDVWMFCDTLCTPKWGRTKRRNERH